MQAITNLVNEEIARLEKLNKNVDMRLKNVPEGCLKYQNINGKIYYYHQYVLKEDNSNINSKNDNNIANTVNKTYSSRIKTEYIKKNSSLAAALANKQYYTSLKQAITHPFN